ncbi:MAG TPA: LamG-like jellyroll fold domain-containing protein, partial [Pyrinomonadaceae bacterium]
SDSLDWSPDGRYIGILWGGEAQGAPPRRVIIYDLQTLIDGKPARGDLLQGAGLNLTGLLRFSPDSQRFVVGHITDFNFSQGVLTFVGVNGSGRTDVKVPGWNPYDPIWWQPGAPIPAPERMEVTPDPITVWAGKSVQMTPTLFDAQGNVIVRAAGAWRTSCFNGSASVSHTGLVTGSTNINYTDQVCAFNAGLSACSVLQNFDIPILSVSATKPEANKSGAGGPGVFTIRRAGNPSGALVIAFTLSGSASRDTDYTLDATGGTISGNTLTLPPNQTSATVNIRPLSNSPGKGDKSVIITIQPDPANAYFINNQSNTARVVLRDDSLPTLSCAPKPSGLANWYRAEDDAKDSAGSRHGTLQGGAGFAQGLVGQAFSLDGKDDYVDLGSLSPGSQWTVEAWVKPSATPSGRRAILGGFGDCNDWGITMENGQIGVVVKPPSGCTQTVSSGVAATPGAWSHVVATNDGKTARIYVNGLERASGAVAANYVGYAASVRVGSEACCGNFFPGLIDEASIYSRALTSSEVQSIYAADRAGKCTTATPPLSLSAVTPDKGGDAGSVTVTIYGQSIKPGATVRLRRSGFADITGTGVSVASGGTFLTASFDLANKAQGAWDVVVTNPDNATAALSAAFTVEASRPAQVWVDVVGRYTVRSNQTQTFYIAYGNSGDVDADATMIRVEIPQPLSVAQLPQLEDGSVPALTVNDALSIIEFYVPKVAANSAKALPMMLRTPDSLGHENVQLLAWAVSSQGLADLAAIRPNPNLTITPQILEATNTPTSVVLKFNLKLGPT